MDTNQHQAIPHLYYVITPPSSFGPGGIETYPADEWEALEKSRQLVHQSGEVEAGSELIDPVPEPAAEAAAEAAPESTGALASIPECAGALLLPPPCPQKPAVRASKGLSIPPDFSRHARRCAVCSHPDRDAIEGDFIRWRSPELIAKEYDLSDRASIYRHAHSTGLFAWRKQELGRTLEGILESSEHLALADSDVIIRAARIYAHLDEHGKWFEPARINFVLTGPASISSPQEFERSRQDRSKSRSAKISNRNSRRFRKSVKPMKRKEKANS